MSKSIFITGTGTDVGKTYVTGLIVKKLKESGEKAAYYKAAMSGNKRDENGQLIPRDAVFVQEISGIEQPLKSMCPYVYENAWSPHLAAKAEGNPVHMDSIIQGYYRLCEQYDYITMEGSGGILCPIRFDEKKIWLEDIIKALCMSCIIIADAGLGTINSVVLTAEYMKNRSSPIKGMIFNHFHKGDLMEEDNVKMCEERTGIRTLACVGDDDLALTMNADLLKELYN